MRIQHGAAFHQEIGHILFALVEHAQAARPKVTPGVDIGERAAVRQWSPGCRTAPPPAADWCRRLNLPAAR
jgi:hypothetical protein